MLIRRERPDDVQRIDDVHRRAFADVAPAGSEPVDVALVRALRADPGWVPALSLVAESSDGRVIGHVVGSEGSVDVSPVIGAGPIGVLPEHQGRHVGYALMHAVLAAADALDYPLVVLLGHTDYYRRFGFVPATTLRISPPDPTWGEHFQARTLAMHRPELHGTVRLQHRSMPFSPPIAPWASSFHDAPGTRPACRVDLPHNAGSWAPCWTANMRPTNTTLHQRKASYCIGARPSRHFGDRTPRRRHAVLVRHSHIRRGIRTTLGRHRFAPRTEVPMPTTIVRVPFRLPAEPAAAGRHSSPHMRWQQLLCSRDAGHSVRPTGDACEALE
jgi:putative acetyltransferase